MWRACRGGDSHPTHAHFTRENVTVPRAEEIVRQPTSGKIVAGKERRPLARPTEKFGTLSAPRTGGWEAWNATRCHRRRPSRPAGEGLGAPPTARARQKAGAPGGAQRATVRRNRAPKSIHAWRAAAVSSPATHASGSLVPVVVKPGHT